MRPRTIPRLLSSSGWWLPLLLCAFVTACNGELPGDRAFTAADPSICAPDNGGLQLPDGFCAAVVVDSLGRARHLTVDEEGDVYVRLRSEHEGSGSVALRDTSGDARADVVEYFGEATGTGVALHDGYLYVSSDAEVFRYPLAEGELVPNGSRETIVTGFPEQGQHAAKSIAIDDSGHLYVNVGAPSNTCQEQSRTPGSSGLDPCPQLERQAGIWRFDADRPGQTQEADGQRYATGIRNAVALTWHDGDLYAAQHGRDQLHDLWPDLYTQEQSVELPAEELFRVTEGADFGWPFCYYDHEQGVKLLTPEYGGDGQEVGRCAEATDPIAAFPGHYAPNAVLLSSDDLQFPAPYANGAFVAFHGSWNRAPQPQQGYMVAFVPFDGGEPAGDWQVFADGFKGAETLDSPGNARFRPVGLAHGPDGALYVADSQIGRVWKIVYVGAQGS